MGEAPLRRQLLDQLFERHVLVQVGGQRGLAHPAEQLAERGLARQVAAQHQGVDEEPDQPLDLHPVAAGDGRAHREVVLAAVARQQGLEAGQQHHEERRSLAPAEGLAACRVSPAGSRTGRVAPRKLCTAGRGRSVGSSRSGGRPASCRRQKAISLSRTSPCSQERCQTAKSAYCTGSSGSGDGRPAANAA